MTIDSATRAKFRLLYPEFVTRILRVYSNMWEQHRIQMCATEGMRTFNRQEYLYAQGRTMPGKIVTNAKPGLSYHHYGIALDSCKKVKIGENPYDLPWDAFGRYAKAAGLTWGGDWNGNGIEDKDDYDKPHVHLSYGYKISELLSIYNKAKSLEAIWATFDIKRGIQAGLEWYGPQTRSKLLELGEL